MRACLPGLAAVLATVLVAVLAAGCSPEGEGQGKGGPAGRGKPAHLVQVASISNESISHRVERTGTLRALRDAKIFNQVEGGVVEVAVHEGDTVNRDDVLVRLDDRILRAELAKAVASRRDAASNAERLRKLKAKRLVSEEALSRATTALAVARAEEQLLRTRLGYMTVQAPFAGKIAQRHVNPGDVAPKHTHLVTLIDPSSLITDVTVSELILPRLAVDDTVEVSVDALGDETFQGRVLRIYPTVDPKTRRGRLEVVLQPVPVGANAGQFCRVTLITQRANRLVMPLAALRRDAAGEHVFLVDDQNVAQRVPVRSGLRLADRVEIIDGLSTGQRVVTSGFLGLTPGLSVKPLGTGAKVARPQSETKADEDSRS